VYSVSSGQFLLDVEFNSKLTSIAVDSAEESGFVGADNGLVFVFSLTNPPRDLKMSLSGDNSNTFKGHTQEVTCLSVSLDGLTLASGSKDHDVRIWHIKSRQCIKTIRQKGTVTTLSYMMPKLGMLDPDAFKADLTFSLLEKTVVDKTVTLSDIYSVNIITHNDSDEHKSEPNARQLLNASVANANIVNQHDKLDEHGDDTLEIKRLKTINNKIYEAAVKAILKE